MASTRSVSRGLSSGAGTGQNEQMRHLTVMALPLAACTVQDREVYPSLAWRTQNLRTTSQGRTPMIRASEQGGRPKCFAIWIRQWVC